MKLHPLTLALAEAPVDPFKPDGEQRFKVVVRSRVHGVVEVTGGHDSPAEALAEFAEVVDRLNVHARMLADEVQARRTIERWTGAHEHLHDVRDAPKGRRRDRR